jgi:hypothetical protein
MFPIAYMTFLGSELGRGCGGWVVDSLAEGCGVDCSVGVLPCFHLGSTATAVV